MAWSRNILACVGLVFAVACDDQTDVPSVALGKTEHVVYFARSGAELCPGTLETLQAHFAYVQRVLGFPWPAGRTIAYHRYADADDLNRRSPCARRHLLACATVDADGAPAVHTPQPVHRHELVHAYLAHVGRPHAIYVEGLAELFRCDALAPSRPRDPDWRSALFRSSATASFGSYLEAAWLLRYLIDRFGAPRVMDAYARSARDSGPDAFAAELQALFGTGVDAIWSDIVSGRYDPPLLRHCGCTEPALIDGKERRLGRCGADSDLGAELVVDVPSPATSAVIESGVRLPTAGLSLRRCDGAPEGPSVAFGGDGRTRNLHFVAELPAGRYFVTDVDVLRVSARPATRDSCAATSPYTLLADRHYGTWSFVGGAEPSYWRVAVGTAQVFEISRAQPVGVCPSCEAAEPSAACSSTLPWRAGDVVVGSHVFVVPPNATGIWQMNGGFCVGPCERGGPGCPAHCAAQGF